MNPKPVGRIEMSLKPVSRSKLIPKTLFGSQSVQEGSRVNDPHTPWCAQLYPSLCIQESLSLGISTKGQRPTDQGL